MRTRLIGLGALAVAAGLAACGGGDETTTVTETAAATESPAGSEPVELDPSEFTTEIDNPYWPMAVGSKWVYRETDTRAPNRKWS